MSKARLAKFREYSYFPRSVSVNKPNMFSYWEGPMPEYIRFCFESLVSVCSNDFNVFVYSESTLPEEVKYLLNPRYSRLSYRAFRVDCIRVALLYLYGGFWVDADTVWLRSPISLIDKSKQIICTNWDDPFRVINGCIYLMAGCPIAQEWLSAINTRLKGDLNRQEWAEYGEKMITPLVLLYKKFRPETVSLFDLKRLFPVVIDTDSDRFFSRGVSVLNLIKSDTLAFGLNHSYFDRVYHDYVWADRLRLLEGDLLFHQVIRLAFK